MSDPSVSGADPLATGFESNVDRQRRVFESAWLGGRRPRIEDHLAAVAEADVPPLLRELLLVEVAYRRHHGERPTPEEYAARLPAFAAAVAEAFSAAESVRGDGDTGPRAGAAAEEPLPERLGRHRITGKLGRGGFGVVYRGRDDELRRDVAIKVPHRKLIATPADVEAYLAEARVLAGLDHPGIVPVYDVGRTDDGLCYLVSKFVDGSDLKARLKQGRPPLAEVVDITARVAEALHHAHQRGLVHRDVKPGNILLDAQGHPVVADFGLALREEDFGTGPGFAGTPRYMSPEQARGEGHRVDARSDVYSLGVVFYELLTGRPPYAGSRLEEILEEVRTTEPRPPRQVEDSVPRELDRICLKCLAKRAADRYSTALDLAEDLRHWQAGDREVPPVQVQVVLSAPGAPPAAPAPAAPAAAADRGPVKVVPKGLRSFDAGDADFFLELLPGPRDRDGLPDSLRFWKGRIEETDADRTFAVGLLYGPSGCGKSSLVKAGLLPRLLGHVVPIYVEATAEETEARLLKGLRKYCPDLAAGLGLVEALAALRRGRGLPAGKKVLLVLDQFEQFLHARRAGSVSDRSPPELVQALRQCDGGRVQAVVLVRDDFWMAATRFMHELEFPLLEGQNSAAADLFDPRHARKVLTAFGRAFGALPDEPAAPAAEQVRFVEQAVDGLAQDGKVISVRLALFAEMVKGRPWTPATLREVGGTAGVGVTFLEETFSASTAPPEHRYHQRAARAVLQALLPEQGTDIKGQMRSQEELQERAGYADRPRDWQQLLRILDGELRLVTPTDPEGTQARSASKGNLEVPLASASGLCGDARFYQLTHDYLVPSLRDWLTRKQRETRRGRAELRLAERAALWTAKPENRHLPAWWEWLSIRLLTRRKDWTPPQRTMMRRASRFHVTQAAILGVFLAAVTVAGLAIWGQVRAQRRQDHATALVQRLRVADTAGVPGIVAEMEEYRPEVDPRLREALAGEAPDSKEHLHVSLALLPKDPGQADYLYGRLLHAGPAELPVIRDTLRGHEEVRLRLWDVLRDEKADAEQRLRAAGALADWEPQDGDRRRWDAVAAFVAGRLLAAVQQNPATYPAWVGMLRPVRERLTAPLAAVFRNPERPEDARAAASILAEYAGDRPDVLADLLADADPKQYATLWPRLEAQREQAVARLQEELTKTAGFDWKDAPLDPAWTTPEPALVGEVEAAGGLVAERFAFCQTLPLERFDAVAAGLRRGGYRPVRLRPYAVAASGPLAGSEKKPASGPLAATGQKPASGPLAATGRVAAVWTRDGRDWQAVHGLTAAEVRRQDGERRAAGLLPADVAGYLDGGQERYAALWVKARKGDDARMYVGVPARRHKADGWGPMRDAKLQPMTLQILVGADGEARFSSVWRKSAAPGTSYWNDDEGTHADRGLGDGLPVDVSVSFSRQYVEDAQAELLGWLGSSWAGLSLRTQNPLLPHPERRYAGCFLPSAAFDYAVAFGLTPEEQQRRGQELAAQGYRLVALSVAASGPLAGSGKPASEPLAATVWHRPVVPDDVKEHLAKRQASAAVALLRLGQAERVWPLLQHRPDPRLRSYLIHRLSPQGADARALVKRLAEEPDVTVKRALLLCLGEFTPEQLPPAQRDVLVPTLLGLYRDDADPGIHGAAEWLLRRWQQAGKLRAIDQELASRGREPPEGRRWYVNGQGQTLALIEGGDFLMGSPRTEAGRDGEAEGKVERQHRRRIGRTFALATKEVTVEQFLRFRKEHEYNKTYSPTPEHPVNLVTWYDAAAYCNWLSRKEGIPDDEWCYQPNEKGEFGPGMRMKPNYLHLTGCRLPTEAEWEFACRAGAVTSRYYGETEELLGQYACYTKNSQDKSMFLPASLKPNDLGLFDMLGNGYEWCQDGIFYYPQGTHGDPIADKEYDKDIEDINGIQDSLSRVLRGGAFTYLPWVVRSAYRGRYAPATRFNCVGLRPARTYH